MDLTPGAVIGRYYVDSLRGEGGQAVVYKVYHDTLQTPYALKVLRTQTPRVKERFLREGRLQASLRHPNIVSVTDVIELDGSPALIMEFVDGPTLDHFLDKGRPELGQVDALVVGILQGVRIAHEQGLVHRDLKPANILLAPDLGGAWLPKVADFGLAKALDPDAQGMTRTGAQMGTPAYMSPEQIRDTKHIDHRSDIFALGAILYEMVTGYRAFEGNDLFELFSAVTSGSYLPPKERVPELPDRMDVAIRGALAIDRERRIPDVATLLSVWKGEQAWAPVASSATPPPVGSARKRSGTTATWTDDDEPSSSNGPTVVPAGGTGGRFGDSLSGDSVALTLPQVTIAVPRMAILLLLALVLVGVAGLVMFREGAEEPTETPVPSTVLTQPPLESIPEVPIDVVPEAPAAEAPEDGATAEDATTGAHTSAGQPASPASTAVVRTPEEPPEAAPADAAPADAEPTDAEPTPARTTGVLVIQALSKDLHNFNGVSIPSYEAVPAGSYKLLPGPDFNNTQVNFRIEPGKTTTIHCDSIMMGCTAGDPQ